MPHQHTLHTSYQPLVPGKDDGVEHGFIEEAVAHPLRYYDVNLLNRKLHLLHLAFEDGDHCNTQNIFVIINACILGSKKKSLSKRFNTNILG